MIISSSRLRAEGFYRIKHELIERFTRDTLIYRDAAGSISVGESSWRGAVPPMQSMTLGQWIDSYRVEPPKPKLFGIWKGRIKG